MYQPPKYKNNNPQFIFNFINRYPFATLVMQGDFLLATHVPVLVTGNENNFKLSAHIANHNPMCKFLEKEAEMLLVFKSADAYISSSWYTSIDIPTWDYEAVHINAKITLQNADELQASLENLIHRFESSQQNPVDPQKIPAQMWDENFKNITGFWLNPIKMVGVSKMHQGFSKEDVNAISKNLESQSSCPSHQVSNILKKYHDN